MGWLEGKVCVIMGAVGGIGVESARWFCEEGVMVVGVDLGEVFDVDFLIVCDVVDEDVVRGMYDQVAVEFGWFDVLFNNAGILFDDDVLVFDMLLEVW